MSTHSPTLWKILSDAWLIITSNLRHYLILSALFILPLPITSVVYLFLVPQPTSVHLQSLSSVLTPHTENTPDPKPQLLTSILITTLSTVLFSLCASPSITHSTFAAFHDKPVKLSCALKTILDSFFPLLVTLFAKQLILGLLFIVFVILMAVGFSLVMMSGLQIRNLYVIMYISMVILVIVLFYFLIKWCLSDAVVVLESNRGFAALKRSSYLVKGTRKVALSMLVLSSALGGVLTVWSFNFVANASKVSKVWTFAQIVVYVVSTTVFPLYGLVATTVLYIYCKASHGETGRPAEAEYSLVPIE